MIATASQKQRALVSSCLALTRQEEAVFQAYSSWKSTVGQRTLSCRVHTTLSVPKAGGYRFALPITPLLIQDKLNAWDQEIREHYKTVGVGLDNAYQGYTFSGWSARVSCCATNTASHPFSPSVSLRSAQELFDSFTLRQSVSQSVSRAVRSPSERMDEWVRAALVENDAFHPHVVVQEFLSHAGERMPLFSQTTATQIFGKKTLTLGKSSKSIEMISGSVLWTSPYFSDWDFSTSSGTNWPEPILYYPVFGEIGVETWCEENAQYGVEITLDFPIMTSLFSFRQDNTTQQVFWQFYSFSGTKTVSGPTLILPGPWVEGKAEWDSLVAALQQNEQDFFPDHVSCVVTITNTTATRIKALLTVMTPEERNSEGVSLTLDAQESFGIESVDSATLAKIRGLSGVKTETSFLDLIAGEAVSLRVQRLCLSMTAQGSTWIPTFLVGDGVLGLSGGLEYFKYLFPSVQSPWEIPLVCSFPFLLSLDPEGPATVHVEYMTLGASKTP